MTVTSGPDGKYSFRGVRPGEYKVFAGPGQLPPGGLTPELLSRIEPSGTSVTVKAGISTKADVTVNSNQAKAALLISELADAAARP